LRLLAIPESTQAVELGRLDEEAVLFVQEYGKRVIDLCLLLAM
jgi:hypothetical protein